MTTHNSGTHAVFNQSSDFPGFNAYRSDPLLKLLTSQFPEDVIVALDRHGRFCGSHEAHDLARIANREEPSLRRFDEKGHRLEMVDFHPAYHALMRRSIAEGLSASIWAGPDSETGIRHRARAARFYMTAGVECGHLCPLTMTSASVAALSAAPELKDQWLPLITSQHYDPSIKPPLDKAGLTLGMGMTEKQGGTDVRANTTRATPRGDGRHAITGHKWFLSAPMCDGFLVLAETEAGPSCFLMPRRRADGSLNGLFIQRLKDKLGNRSNASSEVEFVEAEAMLVGVEGRGIATLLDMVTLTRVDCALASAGLMRGALAEAVHHCRERRVFGKLLIDQPQMIRVLGELALDYAGATVLASRLAETLDRRDADPSDVEARAWARVMTPVTKYWVCKLAPAFTYEAMECLGGNGYVEDGRLARAYREAPVNAIWEGSGNVVALDLLRVLKRDPEAFETVIATIEHDLGEMAGGTPSVLRAAGAMVTSDEGACRLLTEQLALAAAAGSLVRQGLGPVARAFADTRLGGVFSHTYGMIDLRHDCRVLVDDLFPPLR
ncbi:acyl-CoA dehydrogenase family protein [Jiella sp. MQZ9-1]|uniref:Acyl-CoA dehydrogenase family protein n=1 Tax=Jiella flava TaxID=2816857 RepID=A0A939FZU0_9HYPH|nr:acyl-CoA dehydrogenase family protein [Jiella flava]MBO0663751.1 acyl-CoA dehydrogenase family protein [Jiella flava]MCD2472324.1 acyl-CoA dehydrogenase family protein [Jiella flava]